MPENLQFDRADFGAAQPSRVVCTACNQDVVQSYYTIGDRVVCSRCREHAGEEGSAVGRFFRATGAAILVALAGAAVWWAVATFLHFHIALISIGIGIGVARAIVWGTNGRTNGMYRLLAVLITYAGISLGYAPQVITGMAEGSAVRASHVIVGIIASFTAPVFDAMESPIAILIVGFGLWEAWKLSHPVTAQVAGPFSVAPGATTNV